MWKRRSNGPLKRIAASEDKVIKCFQTAISSQLPNFQTSLFSTGHPLKRKKRRSEEDKRKLRASRMLKKEKWPKATPLFLLFFSSSLLLLLG
jgi:hypothetical protein